MAKKNNVLEFKNYKSKNTKSEKDYVSSVVIQQAINAPSVPRTSKKELFETTIKLLLNALKCKDEYTWGHSLRVAYFCISTGKELGLSEDELYELELSALFHDLGKIGVPDSILKKPTRLSDEEFLEMKKHPEKSAEILEEFPVFKDIAYFAKHHHERFDGRGYPSGFKGEEIPLFSRIILISDTFDAMTSTRPYRKGLSFEIAFAELREFSGTQFDGRLVEVFINSMMKEQLKNEDTFKLQILEGEFKKDAA